MSINTLTIGASANYDEGLWNMCITRGAVNIYVTTAVIPNAVYDSTVWPHTLKPSPAVALGNIDGVAVAANNIIIVKDQVDSKQNGVYVANTITSPYTLTRIATWISPVRSRTFISATAGNTNINKGYYVTNQVTWVGITACTFTEDSQRICRPITYCTHAELPYAATMTTPDQLDATVNGVFSIDAIVFSVGNIVLVAHQSNAAQNGVYTVAIVGTSSTKWRLTRLTGFNAAAQPIPANSVFTVNGANGMMSTSVWYLQSAVTTVGTTAWTLCPVPGAAHFTSGMNLAGANATLTIDSDTAAGQNGKALGNVTQLTQAPNWTLVIDGRNVWWIPFRGGSGTVPALSQYGVNDVTQSGVPKGSLLGVWNMQYVVQAPGATMPAYGYVKLRALAPGQSIDPALTLVFVDGVSNVSPLSSGTRGWIRVDASDSKALTLRTSGRLQTRGDWFYLDTLTGADNQRIVTPWCTQTPAVQVETGVGTNVFEWWCSAGPFGLSSSAYRWGISSVFNYDARAKYFGCSTTGVLEFQRRTMCQPPFANVRLVSTSALAISYNGALQRMTASANGALTIDSVAAVNGDRVLVTQNTTRNGIYTVISAGSAGSPFVLQRAADLDLSARNIESGRSVFVTEGTVYGKTYWTLRDSINVDSDSQTWLNCNVPYAMPRCRLAFESGSTVAQNASYDATAGVLVGSSLGALSVDGVSAALGDRVLVWQSSGSPPQAYTGIYKVVATGGASAYWMLIRDYDCMGGNTLPKNAWTRVMDGNTNARSFWVVLTQALIGTDTIAFSKTGVGWEFAPCRLATYLPLPNAPSFYSSDGMTATTYGQLVVDQTSVEVGDRILVTNQAVRYQNGIYSVTAKGSSNSYWTLTRVTGFNSSSYPVYMNARVFVTGGVRFPMTSWTLQTTANGSSNVNWGFGEPNSEWWSVRVATTAPLDAVYNNTNRTLTGNSGTLTVDGVACAVNDTVLVKDQTNASENGVYYLATATAPYELRRQYGWNYVPVGAYSGAYVRSNGGGTVNSDTYWFLTATVFTVGTNPANFVRGGASVHFKSIHYVCTTTMNAPYVSPPGYYSGNSSNFQGCTAANLALGERVLVTGATGQVNNGIYVCTVAGGSYTIERAPGWTSFSPPLTLGTYVTMIPGTRIRGATNSNVGVSYTLTVPTTNPIFIESSPVTFLSQAGDGGYSVPGARVRVPNVILGSITTATTRYLSTAQTYAMQVWTTGYTFSQNIFGGVDSQYAIYSGWMLSFTAILSCILQCCVFGMLVVAGELMTSPLSVDTCAAGAYSVTTGSTATGFENATNRPISLTRTVLADMRNSFFSKASNAVGSTVTMANCYNTTFTSCRIDISPPMVYSGTINASITATVSYETRLYNCTLLGQGPSVTTCDGWYQKNTVYGNRVAGCTSAYATQAYLLVPVNSRSILLDGIAWYADMVDNAPYDSWIQLTSSGGISYLVVQNAGSWSSPLLAGSDTQNSTFVSNSNVLIGFSSPSLCEHFVVRNVYVANARGALSLGTLALFARTCFAESVMWTSNLTVDAVFGSPNSLVRGCRLPCTAANDVVAASVYDNLFRDRFQTDTTGTLIACASYASSRYASYVTLTGNAQFTGTGYVTLMYVGDSITWTWPYTVLGHTGFANSLPTVLPATATNILIEYRLNSGSWKTATGANLSAETVSPTTGFSIALRVTCTVAGSTLAANGVQAILVSTTTTASAQQIQYSLDLSAFTGRATGRAWPAPIMIPWESAVSDVSLTDLGSTDPSSGFAYKPAMDALTGEPTYARVRYSTIQPNVQSRCQGGWLDAV